MGLKSLEVADRLIRYVQVDTQSDPYSSSFPSTEKQKNLSKILVAELQQMGIEDAAMDANGYVMATIPATHNRKVPIVCFCAHVDTAPDCSGTNVKPILHENYNGAPIILPDDPTQIITTAAYPYLKNFIGKSIITASGKTLLGSDDKSGVAIIMEMASYLMKNKNIEHGSIKILFTPDEEIGRGADKVNLTKLGADFAYTMDGETRGHIEDETFSADGLKFNINGVASHPGFAKDKMENAIKIASDIIAALPKDTLSPETTTGREGFVHPVSITGGMESASIQFIIRDFETAKLKVHEQFVEDIANQVVKNYPGSTFDIEVTNQYRNMKEVLMQNPQLVSYAEEAIRRAGMNPVSGGIRGGTDGSRFSFMGLPCPNIFAGEHAFHSKLEWVSVQDMELAVDTIIHLVQIWEEKG